MHVKSPRGFVLADTMRALVLKAYKQFAYEDVPDPEPGSDRVTFDSTIYGSYVKESEKEN